MRQRAYGGRMRPISSFTGSAPTRQTHLAQSIDVSDLEEAGPDFPYFVTVERRGASPLRAQLLVRAPSSREAGDLASCLAERSRGGVFEATSVRRAAKTVSAFPSEAFDDADL
jgi:hypothetical protein